MTETENPVGKVNKKRWLSGRRLFGRRGRDYGQVKEPEHYELLLRLIPHRHTEVRQYIHELKYENRRLMLWYSKMPTILADLREKEIEIRRLNKLIFSMQKRMKKAMGV
jgi:hypothetical protein